MQARRSPVEVFRSEVRGTAPASGRTLSRLVCRLCRAFFLVLSLASLLLANGAPAAAAESAPAGPPRFATGQITAKVPTAHDPSQQYALYLPSGYAEPAHANKNWPVLFVLDPRGRAIKGIERFLPAAERYGYIVLSSYQSRSDTAAVVTVRAMEALSREAQIRFRVNMKRLYLTGMSGTSHASWRLAQAMGEHAAGVIGCVGGVQVETQGPPGDAGFAYYGLTSKIDFNYQEMLRLEQHMLEAGIDHRIDLFEGRHGWSPHEHTNRALDWMELQAMKRGLAPLATEGVEASYAQALAALAETTDPLDVLRRQRDLVRDFDGLRDVSSHQEAIRRIEKSSALEARQALARKLATQEHTYFTQRLGPFLAEFQGRAPRPQALSAALAALRIKSLRDQSESLADLPRANSARRILESLYTTFAFSLPQQSASRGDLERETRALELAIAISPQGVQAHWRLAEAYARGGRVERAFEALRSATSFGKVNMERLRTDPTWEPLRGTPEWQQLLASLGKA